MKKRLWIGSYLTEAISKELKYKNAASYLSQKNIHDAMEQITGEVFDSIGALVVPAFPRKKEIFFERYEFNHVPSARDVLVGYLNVQYICKLSSSMSMVKEAKTWLKNVNQQDEVEIYIYEMRSCCLAAAETIKKAHPNTKVHLIVPDLPAFMDLRMNRIKRILKKIDARNIQKKLWCVDDYILYAAPMAQYLGIQDKKWTVMEGSISEEDVRNYEQGTMEEATSDKCVVMYSGSVNHSFGIGNLLEAFKYLDDTFELWITGSGPAKELVQETAKQDERIKYYGFLPTRADLLALQRKATVMVNMRNPEEAASNYCFPSKLFEYMLLGKPVLSCKLGGIPEEYRQYLIEMRSLKPEDIAQAIRDVSEMDAKERERLGKAAKEFIAVEKVNTSQAGKIIRFAEEV